MFSDATNDPTKCFCCRYVAIVGCLMLQLHAYDTSFTLRVIQNKLHCDCRTCERIRLLSGSSSSSSCSGEIDRVHKDLEVEGPRSSPMYVYMSQEPVLGYMRRMFTSKLE